MDRRGQQLLGAAFIAVVVGAVAAMLLMAGRTLGDGVRFEVEFATATALKADARMRLAGRVVGEVRAMRKSADNHVLVECFVAREFAADVRANSDVFIATPSIVGEAYLEIGPPRSGPPGPPIADGARIRGADPPDLDRLLSRLYTGTTAVLLLLREHRAEIDELLIAGDSLLATLSGLPVEPGQLRRIRDQTVHAGEELAALVDGLQATRVGPRIAALADDLEQTSRRVGPDFTEVARKADLAADRISSLGDLVPPARREEITRALRAIGRAADGGRRIADQVAAIAASVDGGRGTVGGFFVDREIYEDFHETHRILKSQPWMLILKRRPRP